MVTHVPGVRINHVVKGNAADGFRFHVYFLEYSLNDSPKWSEPFISKPYETDMGARRNLRQYLFNVITAYLEDTKYYPHLRFGATIDHTTGLPFDLEKLKT